MFGGATDSVDHGEIFGQKIITSDSGDGAAMLCGKPFRRLFQLVWPHILRRRVDQITGQHFACGDGFQPRDINTAWRNKLGLWHGLAVIPIKAVLSEKIAQPQLVQIGLVTASFLKLISAFWQSSYGSADCKALALLTFL